MSEGRIELWSAGSFAVAPASVTSDHLPSGSPRYVAPRLTKRLTGGEDEAAAVEVLATAEGRLQAQDDDGLSGEVLLPDPALLDALLGTEDAGRHRAGVEAYNRWIADFQAAAPDRLVAVAQIPTTGLDDALAALEAAQASGVRAVSLAQPPAGPDTTPADGDEFWHRAGDRTVVVLGPTWGGVPYAERAKPRVSAGRPSPHVAMLTRLALSGIWDDEPDLRIVIAGVDAGWIPYVLEAADTNYMRTAASRPVDLRREDSLPSDYVRRHAFATFGDDRVAALNTRYFGPHHLLWSAAMPTGASGWPNDEERAVRVTAGLPTETRRLLLGDNCRRVFRLDGAEAFTEEQLADFDRAVLV